MSTKLVSKAEYARIRGCKPQTINQFIKEGLVILSGKKVDVELSNQNLSEIFDSKQYDYAEARSLEKNYHA